MITITRCLARHLRAVFRRALRLSSRDAGPMILFAAGADGLRIQARNASAAVEHFTPGQFPAEQISVPFVFLSDCEGTKAEPVTLERNGDSKTVAQWTDKKIPQLVKYEIKPGTIPVFPLVPATMAENDARLWRVMADAMETVDCDTVRFATDCVQLRSNGGKVVATDGHQLLVQRGFSFPWDGDLLIPHNSLFACKELPLDGSLRIGRSEDWLTLQAGSWTFHLAIDKERRFPKTEDFVLRPDAALTRMQLAEGDATFLTDALQRLPCEEDDATESVNGNGSSSNGHGNGSSNGNGQVDTANSVDVIDKAEALRTTLRTALGQVSELISTLQQQKKTTKSFQSALATLRQLEKVAL